MPQILELVRDVNKANYELIVITELSTRRLCGQSEWLLSAFANDAESRKSLKIADSETAIDIDVIKVEELKVELRKLNL